MSGSNMEIIIGQYSGFCNGVKYTVEEANKILENNEQVYSIGEIVHNERVIEMLKDKKMKTVDSISNVPEGSKVIIRAHGEVKMTYDIAKDKNISIYDLTCGKIKAIRIKIGKMKDDSFIIIIGKKNHPETLGVQSFSGKDSFILENEEDFDDLIKKYESSSKEKIYVVSQTTFNSSKFDKLVDILKRKVSSEIIVDKTICDATSNRQKETDKLSKSIDIMIIVGGKNSSNTKELEVISKNNCDKVYLIQDVNDLKNEKIPIDSRIGIMAGASTPQIVVNEIVDYLESLK